MAHVVVIVLGDIGRSPRMQYHALSFSKCEKVKRVTIVGYRGENPINEITGNSKIHLKAISQLELPILKKISVAHAIFKGMCLVFSLFWILLFLPGIDLTIIQNPPGLPAAVVVRFMSLFNGKKVMVDWHNLGFAMFEEKYGPTHTLVTLSKMMEKSILGKARYHVCVSNAMQCWLKTNFSVEASVLYDRPSSIFDVELTAKKRHNLLIKLGFTDDQLFSQSNRNQVATIQKELSKKQEVVLRHAPERVGFIVSATSWTADEDFNILLKSLLDIEQILATKNESKVRSSEESAGFDRLLVGITGKGPMKQEFEATVQKAVNAGKLGRYVAIRTLWLEYSDYPYLIRCADLGVCLHTSTSGLDLPMKVYDMLGSQVPVCAVSFATLPELILHGENGYIFKDSAELTEQIVRLMVHPKKAAAGKMKNQRGTSEFEELDSLKEGTKKMTSWDENWESVMVPLLKGVL